MRPARRSNGRLTYDIVFHAPRCDGDKLLELGTLTLLMNGVLVQDHVTIQNTGRGCAADQIGEPGPLMLQDHNYRGAPITHMRFRNIWFRRLEQGEGTDMIRVARSLAVFWSVLLIYSFRVFWTLRFGLCE